MQTMFIWVQYGKIKHSFVFSHTIKTRHDVTAIHCFSENNKSAVLADTDIYTSHDENHCIECEKYR